uniref:Uncharacterized protein n=1 Tax=Glossina pallidipes TaxID=7398 RepID=A0A1B0A817_GLOPL
MNSLTIQRECHYSHQTTSRSRAVSIVNTQIQIRNLLLEVKSETKVIKLYLLTFTAELAKKNENPTPIGVEIMCIGVGPSFVGTPMEMEIAVGQQAANQKQQTYTFTYERFRVLYLLI